MKGKDTNRDSHRKDNWEREKEKEGKWDSRPGDYSKGKGSESWLACNFREIFLGKP